MRGLDCGEASREKRREKEIMWLEKDPGRGGDIYTYSGNGG